ncbi:MAG: hypothetical protein DSZ23_01945 [Thermodesulfatator sp.]|nr:MAG: hypothetical protein DSZ23_01945 [Thermodesulfatator sp.]
MAHWSVFFNDIPQRMAGLFSGDEAVWTVLDNLKTFLRDTIKPNLPDNISPGVPVETPIALLPGGWLNDGFETVCNDDTKGKIQVWIEGEKVPEATVICAGAVFVDFRVEVGQGVIIEPGALLKGPVIIGDNTEIRQGAYIREDCLVGSGCVIGHTTEIKHSVFLNGAKAGHFAYVGDSILGNQVNLGAGTKLANLRFGPGSVRIKLDNGQSLDTKRRKLGAILGDNVQTGCNSVMNPGVLLGQGSMICPNTTVSPGLYKPRTILR